MDKNDGFKEFALAKLTSIETCTRYGYLIDMTDVVYDMVEVADELLNYADVYAEFDCEFSHKIKEHASSLKDMSIYFACVCGCYQSKIRKHELSLNRKTYLE